MNELFFNQNWTFKEVVNNIETIKFRVWSFIVFFSYVDLKEVNKFKRQLRQNIYSLNFEVWKCDRILEFIYNDIDIEFLKRLV